MLKYPQIVEKARFEAEEAGVPQVVYEYRQKSKSYYCFSTQKEFNQTLATGKFPMIRLLLCMPNGAVVQ